MQETEDRRVRSLGREDPLRRAWQATPVLWPGEFHVQRSLVGWDPEGHKESDTKLEKAMAPHSSTLAWKIPWMEEPGKLQSMLKVGHD